MMNNRKRFEGLSQDINRSKRQYTMLCVMILIATIVTILTNGTFISARNISNLFLQATTVCIMAVCMCLVIVSGEIDLAAGSALGLCGGVAATMMVNYHWGTIPAILASLAVGLLIGAWQGFWIAYRAIPSFIVTFAGQLIYRGILLGISGGRTFAPLNPSFKVIGQGYVPDIFATGNENVNVTAIVIGIVFCALFIVFELRKRKTRKKYGLPALSLQETIIKCSIITVAVLAVFSLLAFNQGVPYALLIVVFFVLLFQFIASMTVFGRQLFALGGNKEAAKYSGVNIKKNIFTIMLIQGLMCAVAGVMYSARINSAAPSAGLNMEFNAISAAIIGGTSLAGGEGSVIGAIIGAFIITIIDNGMTLLNLSNTYQYVVKGAVLLLAVWIDVASRKKARA